MHNFRLKRLSTEAVPVEIDTSPKSKGCAVAVHLFETGEQGRGLPGIAGIVCSPLEAWPGLVSAWGRAKGGWNGDFVPGRTVSP